MMTLYDFLRAGHVKRWHIINTTRQQTLAEHAYLVTVIALAMYHDEVGVDPDDPISNRETMLLMNAALFHDAPEIRLGDTPTPAKHLIKEVLGHDLNAVEKTVMGSLPFMSGSIRLGENLYRYIDLADKIEAAHWIGENGAGVHAQSVAERSRIGLEATVDRYSAEADHDFYPCVNKVLTALGMQQIFPKGDRP